MRRWRLHAGADVLDPQLLPTPCLQHVVRLIMSFCIGSRKDAAKAVARCGFGCLRSLTCWTRSCEVAAGMQLTLRNEWMQDADDAQMLQELRRSPAFEEACAS